jgi:multidrug efflux pump subunit AcrA (membrane-fusion protein)
MTVDYQVSAAHDSTARRSRLRHGLVFAAAFAVIAAGAAIIALFIRQPAPAATLLVSGNIEAHQSLLSFKQIQSRITELPFDEGQWVEKGTVLAHADDDDYRQQVMLGESQLAARRQELASAVQNLLATRKTAC